MIWEALFTLITAPVVALLSLLSALPDPPDMTSMVALFDDQSGAAHIFGALAWADVYMPVQEAITIGGLMLVIVAATQVVNLTVWLLTKLHLAGGA